MLLRVEPEDRLFVGFALDDGTLELSDLDSTNSLLPRDCCIAAGNPADLVARVHICTMELEGQRRVIVAAATHAGVVSLWDGKMGECMYILDDPYGPIRQVRIVPVPTKRCMSCREYPFESFLLCFSVGHAVLFHRAYLSLPTRKCTCPFNQPKLMSSIQARKNRSGSNASLGPSSGTSSPIHPRSRPSSFSSSTTAFDASSMYPVSAHGVHSRRTSDKRTLDAFIPLEADEFDGRNPVGPQDAPHGGTVTAAFLTPGQQHSSLWENLIVSRTAEATVERGGWDIAGGQVVGVRRRSRVSITGAGGVKSVGSKGPAGIQPRVETKGLTPATLERWELWTFDPSHSQLQASPLVALDEEARAAASSKAKMKTSADATTRTPADKVGRRRVAVDVVPRLHFTRVSPFVCCSGGGTSPRAFCLGGFGNTIGLFDLGAPGARRRPSTELLPSG